MDLDKIMTDLFINNPWMALFVFIIALLGIVLTIIFGLKSLKRKWPRTEMKSSNLIDNFISNYSGLKIKLNDHDCENMTVTKIVFWNKGRDTINNSDITTTDKLTIKAGDGVKIFAAEVIKTVNNANNFKIYEVDNLSKVSFDFEYLDKDEGAVMQIIHSGKDSDDLVISGTIKGFGKLKSNKIPLYFLWLVNLFYFIDDVFYKVIRYLFEDKSISLEDIKKMYKKKFIAVFLFIMPIFFALGIMVPSKPLPLNMRIISLIIIFILYYPMGFYLIKRKIPKKLDIL